MHGQVGHEEFIEAQHTVAVGVEHEKHALRIGIERPRQTTDAGVDVSELVDGHSTARRCRLLSEGGVELLDLRGTESSHLRVGIDIPSVP